METLTLPELKALLHAVNNAYWETPTITKAWEEHGMQWLSLKEKIRQQIKDLDFDKEFNPLPFPKD